MLPRIVNIGGIVNFFLGGLMGYMPEAWAKVVSGRISYSLLAGNVFPIQEEGISEDLIYTTKKDVADCDHILFCYVQIYLLLLEKIKDVRYRIGNC